jgi:hypothetical protein
LLSYSTLAESLLWGFFIFKTSASFLITFLSPEIATSMNKYVYYYYYYYYYYYCGGARGVWTCFFCAPVTAVCVRVCVCVLSNIQMTGVAIPWSLRPRPEMYAVFATRRWMGNRSVYRVLWAAGICFHLSRLHSMALSTLITPGMRGFNAPVCHLY